ncbi:EAL domain-containing protein [Archangium violaceum]|uniref:EAL domain-containing protein n=1 Tax=Archangium violaceum TaxID=83451 RepID=UPI001950B919|nr:EAL domain-containing protein [Archangium violaceum]QRO00393.1 EAL domain-containing protein [Archangium violaceum]
MSQTESKKCERCQTLPEKLELEGPGRLFLWLPLGHSYGKLVRMLGDSGREHQSLPQAQCVAVRLDGAHLSGFVADVLGALTGEEAKSTRALFVEGGGEPGLGDFPRVVSLPQFFTLTRAGWLVDLLAEKRVTSFYQPIVHAKDTRQVYAYEALLRGLERDGSLVSPAKMLSLARDADMLFQLDLAARLSAVREAARLGIQAPLFINFTPTAIYDPAYCLRSTVAAISELGIPPSNVVFEIIESDHTPDANHLKTLIAYYRQAGFRVALDDLGAGYSSLNLIHQLRPDIMKLDMELIRGIHQDAYKASITEKLLELAQKLGILTVAEGIETPEELRWVRAHGVDFVQGYLIAKPSSPPVSATPHFID